MALPIPEDVKIKLNNSASLEQLLRTYDNPETSGSTQLGTVIDASQIVVDYLKRSKEVTDHAQATNLENMVGTGNVHNALVYDSLKKNAPKIKAEAQKAYEPHAQAVIDALVKDVSNAVGRSDKEEEILQKLANNPYISSYLQGKVKQRDPRKVQGELAQAYAKAGIRIGQLPPELVGSLFEEYQETDARKVAKGYITEQKLDGKTFYRLDTKKLRSDLEKNFDVGRNYYLTKEAEAEQAAKEAKKKAA